jgi:hypothetical protein
MTCRYFCVQTKIDLCSGGETCPGCGRHATAGMEKPNALAPGRNLGLPGVDTEDEKTPH